MHRRQRAIVCLGLASTLSGGCSWIFTEGPPPNHAALPYFQCSTSYAPPVLDTIWGGLNFLGAVNAAGQDSNYENRDTIMATGFIWTLVSGASAIYGYSKVSQCQSAQHELMFRQTRAPHPEYGYPPAYPPGTPGYPPYYPRPQGSPPSYPQRPAAPPAAPAMPAPPSPPEGSDTPATPGTVAQPPPAPR